MLAENRERAHIFTYLTTDIHQKQTVTFVWAFYLPTPVILFNSYLREIKHFFNPNTMNPHIENRSMTVIELDCLRGWQTKEDRYCLCFTKQTIGANRDARYQTFFTQMP